MKKQRYYIIAIATVLMGLSACGGKSKKQGNVPNRPNTGYYNNSNCAVPTGVGNVVPLQVIGVLGNGATIELNLYEGANGTMQAVGQVNISSVESLYGYTQNGTSTPFSSCVTSEGTGIYNRENVYQDITMVLRGNGITIEFGTAAWGGVDTYIRNDRLIGNAWLSISSIGRPEQTHFLMASP